MSKRLDQLLVAKDKITQKKHSVQQEEKRLDQQISKLKRDERTHRLCTRGACLEKFILEPELLTDEDVFSLLDYAFGTPMVRDRLQSMLAAKRHGSDSENPIDAGGKTAMGIT